MMAVLLITAEIPDECESVGSTCSLSVVGEELVIQVPIVGPRWNKHKLNPSIAMIDDDSWKRISFRIQEVE